MKCINCSKESNLISKFLGICLDCIRNDFQKVRPHLEEVHQQSRKKFNLPAKPPKDEKGVKCKICTNECLIPEGERGYCGLRKNVDGKLVHLAGTAEKGILDWYYDPLPTNCVAEWVCSGGRVPPHSGYKNLAVFYRACTFNCLFCQNWHFRQTRIDTNIRTNSRESFIRGHSCLSAEELVRLWRIDEKTYCVCYFGGDPTPQIGHALATSRIILRKKNMLPQKRVRICWETNGSMNQGLLKEVALVTSESGGCIKFDLKTYNENLNLALCGVSNRRTLENFAYLNEWIKDKSRLNGGEPFLIASTLLVPGYIDTEEVYKIAKFIAQLNSEIPYSLLAFYPQFFMPDLPVTSRKQAEECYEAAKRAGLKNINLGNVHLLL